MKKLITITLITLSIGFDVQAQDCTHDRQAQIAKNNMDEGDDGLTCANAALFYAKLCQYNKKPLTPEQGAALKKELIAIKKAYNDYGIYCKDIDRINDQIPDKHSVPANNLGDGNNTAGDREVWENQLEGLYVKEMAENLANAYSQQLDQYLQLLETNDPDAFINDFNQKIQNVNILNKKFKQDQFKLGLEGVVDMQSAVETGDEASFYRSVGAVTGLVDMMEARKKARKKAAELYEQRRTTMSKYYWDALDRTNEQIEEFKKLAAFAESQKMEAYYLKLVENLECFKVEMDENWTSTNTSWLKNNCPLPQKPEKEMPNNLISQEQRIVNVAKYKFEEYQKRREEYIGIGAEIGKVQYGRMPIYQFINIKSNGPVDAIDGLAKKYNIKELKVFYSEEDMMQRTKQFSLEEKLSLLQEKDSSLVRFSNLSPELINFFWMQKAQLKAKGKKLASNSGSNPWSDLIPVQDGYFYRSINENTWIDTGLKFNDIWKFTMKKEDELNNMILQLNFPNITKQNLEFWKNKFIQEKEAIKNASFEQQAYTGFTSGNNTVDEFYQKFILLATLFSHPISPLANEIVNHTYRVKGSYRIQGGQLESISNSLSKYYEFHFIVQEFDIDGGGLGEIYPLQIRKSHFVTNKGENYRNAAISFASKAVQQNPSAENYFRVAQYAKDESSVIALTNLIAAYNIDKAFFTGEPFLYFNYITELVNEEIKTAIEEKNTEYIDGFLKSRLQKFVKINGKDIFVYAIELDQPLIAQRILNAYAEGVTDSERIEITQSAMMACAEFDSPKTLQRLIELGISTDFTKSGKTPKNIAKENNSSRVLSILNK